MPIGKPLGHRKLQLLSYAVLQFFAVSDIQPVLTTKNDIIFEIWEVLERV